MKATISALILGVGLVGCSEPITPLNMPDSEGARRAAMGRLKHDVTIWINEKADAGKYETEITAYTCKELAPYLEPRGYSLEQIEAKKERLCAEGFSRAYEVSGHEVYLQRQGLECHTVDVGQKCIVRWSDKKGGSK